MSKPDETKESPKEEKVDVFTDIVALSKSVDEIAPSEQILTSLSPRKPRKDEFVRCHPDLRVSLNVYEDKINRVDYVIGVDALAEMEALVGVRRILLTLTTNYQGEFFSWPVPIPADVRSNQWHRTAFQACEEATRGWTRIKPGVDQYIVYKRVVENAKTPVWPDEVRDTEDLARLTYGGAGGGDVIEGLTHDVIRRLKGDL